MAVHANPAHTPFVVARRRSPKDRTAAARRAPEAAEILFVFVFAVCVMVVTVALVAVVDRWWALVPAFLVAVACELAVLKTINHLLADEE